MNLKLTMNSPAMKAPFLFAFLAFAVTSLAQPNLTPGAQQTERILVLGGTAHLGTGEVIENASIGFADGCIDYVGAARDVDPKRYARVVDAEGKHIYPGFIAPNSTLGLMEIAAVRASRDYAEVGTFKPNVRSVIAYNAASDITPTVRTNGVLMGQITPRGGVIGGSSSVLRSPASRRRCSSCSAAATTQETLLVLTNKSWVKSRHFVSTAGHLKTDFARQSFQNFMPPYAFLEICLLFNLCCLLGDLLCRIHLLCFFFTFASSLKLLLTI